MMQTDDEYFDSNEFRSILTAYEESVSAGTPIFMDTDDLLDIADFYNMSGDREKAGAAIDTALELNPGATLPLAFKAREALAREDLDTAMKYSAEITDKNDPDYKFLQAEILVAQDKIDEAEKCLEDFFSSTASSEHDDFILDIATMYTDYGVFDKALDWLSRSHDSDNAEYLDTCGRALTGLERYKECMDIYDRLIDADPRSTKWWGALANVQLLAGMYSDAITSSEYALAINPQNANALMTKADSLYKIGNFEEALVFYTRYNKECPNDGYGELYIGTCLMHLGNNDRALLHLNKAAAIAALSEDNYEAQVYEAMAFAYSAKAMPEKALSCLKKAQTIDNCDTNNAELCIMRGHILLENGMDEEAEALFRNAIIESGNSPDIMLRVIISLLDNKHLKKAYQLFKLFFETVGHDFKDGYSYMALCCWQLMKLEEFHWYLGKALEHNPTEASTVLGSIIPRNISIEDFFNEINKKLKRG